MMAWLRYALGIVITLILADGFVRWFARLPYELAPVTDLLGAVSRAIGISDPQAVEMLGIVLLYGLAILLIGPLIWFGGTWFSRVVRRRSRV
jgi:hypothetical protein